MKTKKCKCGHKQEEHYWGKGHCIYVLGIKEKCDCEKFSKREANVK